ADLRLNRYACSLFSVIQAHTAQDRFPFRDLQMERPVMPEQDCPVLIICCYDLAETSAFSNNITDLHCKTSFQVALACARDSLCRKERMSNDKSALYILIMISRSSVIIVCQRVQIKFFHQFLLGHCNFCRPVELLLRRFLSQRIRRVILADNKELLDLPAL